MKKITFTIIATLLFSCNSKNNTEISEFRQLSNNIDYYSKNIVKNKNINSISVAIYKNGKTYHNYYGAISNSIKNKPTDQSLFEIASISKTFTGILLAKAVSEKKVNINNDIRKYLPGSYPNLEYDGVPVKIKNLITHTLGFETPKGLKNIYKKIFSGTYNTTLDHYEMKDLFNELKSAKVVKKPGTYYNYNNVGPEIAAYILTEVYQKPFKEILSDFFIEVGMKNTYLQEYDKHRKQLIVGHDENGNIAKIDYNPLLGGASGVITSIPDLIVYMKFLLESNRPYIKESISSKFNDEDENIGYFWDLGVGETEGFYYLKSGTSNGTQSIILLCPDSNYGELIIMNNTTDIATNNWINLYNKIENDLIIYPKQNLWTKVEPIFRKNPEAACETYLKFKNDTINYYASSQYLNGIGYEYINDEKINSAIEIFKIAIKADNKNSNLYDSLGEAYFLLKNYTSSKENYEKSLKLNPQNDNAKKYLEKLKNLLA
jgi:CubicO group peptidase (beta-lactamase class C family)